MSNKIKDSLENASLHAGYKINRAIKAKEVRLIDVEGKNLGIFIFEKALEIAEDAGLDLVQISDSEGHDSLVTAKIMDIGKFLYEKKKQKSIAKKNQKVIEVKEVKMRPNIGDNDYKIKVKQACEFIKKGKHVKFSVQFKGRVISMLESVGTQIFQNISRDLHSGVGMPIIESKESRPHNVPLDAKVVFWSKVFNIKDND